LGEAGGAPCLIGRSGYKNGDRQGGLIIEPRRISPKRKKGVRRNAEGSAIREGRRLVLKAKKKIRKAKNGLLRIGSKTREAWRRRENSTGSERGYAGGLFSVKRGGRRGKTILTGKGDKHRGGT